MFRISVTSKVAYCKSQRFKKLTFDALSFFFLMQLDERMLSSGNITGLKDRDVKNALSLRNPLHLIQIFYACIIAVVVAHAI